MSVPLREAQMVVPAMLVSALGRMGAEHNDTPLADLTHRPLTIRYGRKRVEYLLKAAFLDII